MTYREIANSMHEMAKALEDISDGLADAECGLQLPYLDGEAAVGAAAIVCYLRDLITVSPKTSFSQGELLVVLEQIASDGEIFPAKIGIRVWEADNTGLGLLDA